MVSLQRVIDVLKTECNLTSESAFIDVGSGLGKPPLHVAQVAPPSAFSRRRVRGRHTLVVAGTRGLRRATAAVRIPRAPLLSHGDVAAAAVRARAPLAPPGPGLPGVRHRDGACALAARDAQPLCDPQAPRRRRGRERRARAQRRRRRADAAHVLPPRRRDGRGDVRPVHARLHVRHRLPAVPLRPARRDVQHVRERRVPHLVRTNQSKPTKRKHITSPREWTCLSSRDLHAVGSLLASFVSRRGIVSALPPTVVPTPTVSVSRRGVDAHKGAGGDLVSSRLSPPRRHACARYQPPRRIIDQ